VIPAASAEAVRHVETRLTDVGSVSRRLAEDGIDGVVGAIFGEFPFEARESLPVRFRCACSRAELLPRLVTLSAADRAEIAEPDGSVTAQCAFCGTVYVFAAGELGVAPDGE
jgi:molecular chaperone Hsp33